MGPGSKFHAGTRPGSGSCAGDHLRHHHRLARAQQQQQQRGKKTGHRAANNPQCIVAARERRIGIIAAQQSYSPANGRATMIHSSGRAGGVHMLPLRTSLRADDADAAAAAEPPGRRVERGRSTGELIMPPSLVSHRSDARARALYTWRSGNNNHCR